MQSRMDAYAGLAEGDAPRFWTPELVGLRMIEAYEVISRLPSNWLPAKPRSLWPAYRQEWADLLDPEAYRLRLIEEVKTDPPGRDEMSRAEEALSWPMDHLHAHPLHADALMVWAGCLATGQSIRRKLAARNARAKAQAALMTTAENARREAIRRALAGPVVAWANERLADAAGDPERCRNIRANADIRIRREIDAANAWATEITPSEAMPGRIRVEKTLSRYRKAASSMLADVLNEAEKPVRMPAITDQPSKEDA